MIGGGAIGCEFASMLADLGSAGDRPRGAPADPARRRQGRRPSSSLEAFKGRGIDVRTGVKVEGHDPGDGGTTVRFGDGETLEVDAVIVSVGRRPLSETLGLDGTGVKVDERGFVDVDELCRTGEDGVWAVGDVIATPGLAHVGFAEAILVIKQILGEPAVPVDYDRVAWCIYCHPEVAFAGLSEEAAKEAGLRRRRLQAPLDGQQPGADRRRDRRHGEGHRREAGRRHRRAACWACTWPVPGSPSSSARATWR